MPSSLSAVWRALLLVPLVCAPGAASAQDGCVLGEGSERALTSPDPRGGAITRLTAPHFVCADGVEIWSDSTVAYQFDAMAILYGSVRYVDRQRELRADFARYFTDVGRLIAEGGVFVTNYEDGSTVEHGDLVYLRQTEGREIEEMTFTTGADGLRPRAVVYPTRSTPEAEPPEANVAAPELVGLPEALEESEEPEQYIVVGDRLVFRGNAYFNARGTVEIERDSLLAFADSAEYNGDRGDLVLDGSARVDGSSFDLVGRTITLASADDGTEEVRALRDAVLTGEDLNVTAPRIVLYLTDGELQRMVAVPLADGFGAGTPQDSSTHPVRPIAISEEIELTGDSLDLAAPGGSVERIFSAGNARSVSSGRPDLNIESLPLIARMDWIEADTIEVLLIPVSADSTGGAEPRGDAAGDYEVERIIARVGARSLYRLLPADSTADVTVDGPALSYMVANQITIFMVDGQADRVESIGEVEGLHLEPLRRAQPDSIAGSEADRAASDSTSVEPDAGNGGDGAPPVAYLFPVRPEQPRRHS